MPSPGVFMLKRHPLKVHIHDRSPKITAKSRGPVIDPLCELHKLSLVMVPQ